MLDRPGTRSFRKRPCLALALLALGNPARAAETWLHPVLPQTVVKAAPTPARRGARTARPPAPVPTPPFPTALSGDSSFVELTTGERYPEAGVAVPPERIDRSFVRLGGGRPLPLTSAKVDGPSTRLEATWAGQGLATLGIFLLPEARTVEAAAFDAFLREVGATEALALREKKKETKKPARVVAVESARAFAGVVAPPRSAPTADPETGRDEPLGLPLEIVAGAPPLVRRVGTPLTVTVLRDGTPLPGALVRAYAPGGEAPAHATADSQGVVTLPLEQEGRLLLATAAVRRTVKADRARGEAWKKAEWEIQRSTLELLVLPKAPDPTPTPTPKGRRAAPKKKPG
jgi:hypothetical protein